MMDNDRITEAIESQQKELAKSGRLGAVEGGRGHAKATA